MYTIITANERFAARWKNIIRNVSHVNVLDSIDNLKQYLSTRTTEVIILDMTIPDAKQTPVLKSIIAAKKSARLILAGIAFTPETELMALALGAVACCSPVMSEEECRKILEVVSGKGVWISSSGIPALLEKLKKLSPPAETVANNDDAMITVRKKHFNSMTRREHEIARLVAEGKSNKEIGNSLKISERTVKSHLTTIFDKLYLNSRAQLMAYMIKN